MRIMKQILGAISHVRTDCGFLLGVLSRNLAQRKKYCSLIEGMIQ
mgnify:CR=1 FL=1